MPPVDAVTLALGAGLVAAVNPCGFALLPAYLSIFVLEEGAGRSVAIGRALRATAAMTLGFTGVFALFGLVIAPVAASVQNVLPVFTVLLGLLLVGVGLWTLSGRGIPTPSLPWQRGRPMTASVGSMIGFGASYAIASLGCTIAPFLAVVVTAFRGGTVGQGMILFLTYALGMGLTIGVAAVATALARTGLIRTAQRVGGILPRVAGALLVLAGGYVAWYGFWELRVIIAGAGPDPVIEAAAGLQRFLSDTAELIGPLGLLLALIVLVGVGLVIAGIRGRTGSERAEQDHHQS